MNLNLIMMKLFFVSQMALNRKLMQVVAMLQLALDSGTKGVETLAGLPQSFKQKSLQSVMLLTNSQIDDRLTKKLLFSLTVKLL